mgnify:FL=1|tara:strand:+ start:605 stop:1072 length:468 start_codon:yes stop_codon:yes gene_type:complete
MSYNKTYSEIKTLLKTSERVGKTTMLKIARLAIKETLGDRVEIEDIKWDSKFLDLDADSLDMVELVMFLEECFGIEIADEEAGEIVTVGDAIEVIKKAKANKGKKKKINVSKYKKKANPDAPLTAAKQFTKATEAAAKKTEELEIEIEEALKEEE